MIVTLAPKKFKVKYYNILCKNAISVNAN